MCVQRNASSISKVDLFYACMDAGFIPLDNVTPATRMLHHDTPRFVSTQMLFRSVLYFKVLQAIDSIFGKGVQCVYHGACHDYYAALLTVDDATCVNAINAITDAHLVPSSTFKAMIKGDVPGFCFVVNGRRPCP